MSPIADVNFLEIITVNGSRIDLPASFMILLKEGHPPSCTAEKVKASKEAKCWLFSSDPFAKLRNG